MGNSEYDSGRLTIGFAKRFATYKQADLFLDYLDIMRQNGKHVNIVIAGKSHFDDEGGKKIIQKIIKYAKGLENELPIWFIQDYDMAIARYLVQGVDLWLNNPERLREAAGTSGMKAAANFVPQFSIIDGWWMPQDAPPGYNLPKGLVEGVTGWGIGRMPTEADFLLLQDTQTARSARERDRAIDGKDLVTKLRDVIIPTFHHPSDWVKVMRGAAQHNAPWFNSHRMAIQYFKEYGLEETLERLDLLRSA